MSIPEMKEIKRKDIDYKTRLMIAIKNRAYSEVAKKLKTKSSVEAFNNRNLRRDPDSLGITLYHPNKEAPTHIITRIFPISIGERQFEIEIKKLEKELMKKVEE